MKFWKKFEGRGRAQVSHTPPEVILDPRTPVPNFYSMQKRLEKVAEIRKRGSLCLRWGIAGTFVPARLSGFVKQCLVEDGCSGHFNKSLVDAFEYFLLADAEELEPHRLFMNS